MGWIKQLLKTTAFKNFLIFGGASLIIYLMSKDSPEGLFTLVLYDVFFFLFIGTNLVLTIKAFIKNQNNKMDRLGGLLLTVAIAVTMYYNLL